MTKEYSKERLEKSIKLFLEPRVDISLNSAMNRLKEDNMSEFLFSVMTVDSSVEHHIMNNCSKAENENVRIKCVNETTNVKIRALNKLSEALVERCGGKLSYTEEEISPS